MEIDELQLIAHLFLVLDLGICFKDLTLQWYVFQLQLVYECLLRFEFVIHVFHQLFCIVFAGSSVLRCRQKAAKIESFFSNFCNWQIGTFKNCLESFKKCFRFLTTFVDVVLECLEFLVSNFILLFRIELLWLVILIPFVLALLFLGIFSVVDILVLSLRSS